MKIWGLQKLRVFIFSAARIMNATSSPRGWLISPDTAGIGVLSFLDAVLVVDAACVVLFVARVRVPYIVLLLSLLGAYVVFHLYNYQSLLARKQWRALKNEFTGFTANDLCFSGVCILLLNMVFFAAFAYMGSVLSPPS